MYQTATEETYQDGEIIVEEGSSGDWIYVIEEGAVEISKMIEGQKKIIGVLKKGEVFGELGFITKEKRAATACAIGETVVGIIDRNYLDQEFNKLSAGFRAILMSLVSRLKKATEDANLVREAPRGTKVISLTYKQKNDLVNAFSQDNTDNGMFIKTLKPLADGERFFLKLHLPDASEALKIGCEVSWSRTETGDSAKQPPGMGVKFIQITGEDAQRLKEAL
ncbi:cyclic nucleotide-binding domain-containing protein [Thermodesulfobacteriota bacterium]